MQFARTQFLDPYVHSYSEYMSEVLSIVTSYPVRDVYRYVNCRLLDFDFLVYGVMVVIIGSCWYSEVNPHQGRCQSISGQLRLQRSLTWGQYIWVGFGGTQIGLLNGLSIIVGSILLKLLIEGIFLREGINLDNSWVTSGCDIEWKLIASCWDSTMRINDTFKLTRHDHWCIILLLPLSLHLCSKVFDWLLSCTNSTTLGTRSVGSFACSVCCMEEHHERGISSPVLVLHWHVIFIVDFSVFLNWYTKVNSCLISYCCPEPIYMFVEATLCLMCVEHDYARNRTGRGYYINTSGRMKDCLCM